MTVKGILSRRTSKAVGAEADDSVNQKVAQVLHILRTKPPSLSPKQLDYCNETCILRFLRSKGNNVKRAAKHIRETLSWRSGLDIDYLTADEFPAELADGIAYVAGHDEERRPVVIVRIMPHHLKNHAQKQLLRYFTFTIEVAITSMDINQQCVIIFNTGNIKGPLSPLCSLILQIFKVLSEHYPQRLALSFLVDAPPMFHYLWKGLSTFYDLGMKEGLKFISTKNWSTPLKSNSTASHLMRVAKTYSNNKDVTWMDDQERPFQSECPTPTHSSTSQESCNTTIPNLSPRKTTTSFMYDGSALLDKTKARSFSFANKSSSSSRENKRVIEFRSFRDLSKANAKIRDDKCHLSQQENGHARQSNVDLFTSCYLKFIECPYSETYYRASMRPPLAGLISIVSPKFHIKHNMVCKSTCQLGSKLCTTL